jgi:hypothetical protein
MGSKFGQMVRSTKGNGSKTIPAVRAPSIMHAEINSSGNGKIIVQMDMESIFRQMDRNTKVIGKTTCNTAEEKNCVKYRGN